MIAFEIALYFVVLLVIVSIIVSRVTYKKLESEILGELGIYGWDVVSYYDEVITVKSRQTLEKYDDVKYFKEFREDLVVAERELARKNQVRAIINRFLQDNGYKNRFHYRKIEKQLQEVLLNAAAYRICVQYITSAGNNLGEKEIAITRKRLQEFREDPSLLMGKAEYNKLLKEQMKVALEQKHRAYYDRVNEIIDYANANRERLVVKDSVNQLDKQVAQLFDRTVNSIKKIKTVDSEEWDIIDSFIKQCKKEVKAVVEKNLKILAYYDSEHFASVKNTCETLMSSQREFNEYISEKVQSISRLFGTKVVRNETVNDDEYEYIRPYRKTITPFTAEVSATVFASAENSPLEYIVKNFYPNKALYPEQIRKLHLLLEELETLREAKQIIERYKMEYQQYLGDVPQLYYGI